MRTENLSKHSLAPSRHSGGIPTYIICFHSRRISDRGEHVVCEEISISIHSLDVRAHTHFLGTRVSALIVVPGFGWLSLHRLDNHTLQ